jgi:hypothetical protein
MVDDTGVAQAREMLAALREQIEAYRASLR